MTRQVIKPSKEMVEAILNNEELLCYQYVNWWLYQKGSDEIIWTLDENSALMTFCQANKKNIIAELAKMLGAKAPTEKYKWLLG